MEKKSVRGKEDAQSASDEFREYFTRLMEREIEAAGDDEIRRAALELVQEERRSVHGAVDEHKRVVRNVVEEQKLKMRDSIEELRRSIANLGQG